MKLVILSGSTRNRSTSRKVAVSVQQMAERSQCFDDIELLDFAKLSLPIWDRTLKGELTEWREEWQSVTDKMQGADAIIIVSPEWEEVCLENFYAFCQLDGLPLIPGAVLRIGSNCRGAYSSTDLWMTNFCHNSACLLLDHFNVATIELVNNCKTSYYPFDPVLTTRLENTLYLMQRVVLHGGLNFAEKIHLPCPQ